MSSVVSRQQTKWSHVVFVNRDKNINDGYLNSMAKDFVRQNFNVQNNSLNTLQSVVSTFIRR